MKKITTLTSALLFTGGVLFAQTTPPPSGTSGTYPQQDRDRDQKSHHSGHHNKVTAEVVSTDATAKTITVRNMSREHYNKQHRSGDTGTSSTATGATSGEMTLQVQGKAVDRLASLSPGDRVTLSCQGTTTSSTGSNATSGSDTSKETTAASTSHDHCPVVTDIVKAGSSEKK